jgi:hypothetical protein
LAQGPDEKNGRAGRTAGFPVIAHSFQNDRAALGRRGPGQNLVIHRCFSNMPSRNAARAASVSPMQQMQGHAMALSPQTEADTDTLELGIATDKVCFIIVTM